MKFVKAALCAIAACLSGPCLAWDGTSAGTISAIDVVPTDNNFDVRVYLDGTSLCGTSTANWAYINTSAANYQATVAALYSAWLGHRTVLLFLTKTTGSNCEIGYLHIS